VGGVGELYRRFRQVIHEGAKFLVVGLIGTVVTFGVANALRHSIGEYAAITVATIIATVVTFLGNGYWAFRSRQGQGTARDAAWFIVLNGVGLLIYYACIWLVKDVAGLKGALWYNFALVVGTGLGTIFRFWSYRKWVWGTSHDQAQAQAQAEAATPAESVPDGRGSEGPGGNGQVPSGPRHRAPAGRR